MLARAREFVLVVRHVESWRCGILVMFAALSPVLLSEVDRRKAFEVRCGCVQDHEPIERKSLLFGYAP
jgi:hypothetical protein